MDFILGATLIVMAMALLHAGRMIVERTSVIAPRRETLVTDIFAVIFTGLMGPGLIMFLLALAKGLDIAQVALLGLSVAAVVIGSRMSARTFRRLATRPLAAPVVGIQPQ